MPRLIGRRLVYYATMPVLSLSFWGLLTLPPKEQNTLLARAGPLSAAPLPGSAPFLLAEWTVHHIALYQRQLRFGSCKAMSQDVACSLITSVFSRDDRHLAQALFYLGSAMY